MTFEEWLKQERLENCPGSARDQLARCWLDAHEYGRQIGLAAGWAEGVEAAVRAVERLAP